MAGSLKNMIYRSDDSGAYSVMVDESNGESFAFDDLDDGTVYSGRDLPRGMTMRYLNWRSLSGNLSRKFWVGTPVFPPFLTGGNYTVKVLSGNALVDVPGTFTSAVGEVRKLSRTTSANDSGLNDGDPT